MATNKRKRKKKSARARQKQRLMMLAGLFGIFLLVMIVAIVHINQKEEKTYESNVSVLFIENDGTVVTNDVVAFDTDKYSTVELEVFINETINTYNKEHGEDSVIRQSLVVENNIASLILTYADVDTYEDFTDSELFVGSIAEAVASGYKFDGQFASIVDGKAIASNVEKFYGQTDLKVAIVKANTKIQVDGDILYVSTENVAGFGENWIITKEGSNLLNSSNSGNSGNSGAGQSTESEAATDTELSDGSVDGTELVTEEDTEIIFDFGDEDISDVEEDSYSEVYTYIIFR